MAQQKTKELIKNALENSFNPNSFKLFINNLLNRADFSKSQKIFPEEIGSEYTNHIKSCQLLGEYIDKNGKKIHILTVQFNNEGSVERARTFQRNFIAKYLKYNPGIDSSLVAFFQEDSPDWRFSFVKLDLSLNKKGNLKYDFTPARRYSFLVGKNEFSHTAQSQLAPIIENEGDVYISDIEECFHVEKVTKEFFEKYLGLFDKLLKSIDSLIKKDIKIKKEFEDKNIEKEDFAKRILGQIVFLYFLQKKGWLGIEKDQLSKKFKKFGEGDKNFLYNLFKKCKEKNKNFFNDYLEHLFYSALAQDRRADDDQFHLQGIDYKLPFLNGGLFEPIGINRGYNWRETDILISNEIFSNSNGEGILDVFNLYNFTVKEDEPMEKEVAIDPEMLGKVFENLLDTKERKSTGSFYTPREIVHYMCQQSLINYLETNTQIKRELIEKFVSEDNSQEVTKEIIENKFRIDNLLKEIKVVDPAVGSGAFLVGMMSEIVKCRSSLNSEKKIFDLKEKCIENNLHGVDISPGAVDICQLRLWLSLIVDEDDYGNVKPLPNLDYKIMCGNSLIEEYNGMKIWDDRWLGIKIIKTNRLEKIKEIEIKINKIKSKIPFLFNQKEEKDKLEKEIKKLEKEKKEFMKNGGENMKLNYSDSERKLIILKKYHEEFTHISDRIKKQEQKKKIEDATIELIKSKLIEENKKDSLKEVEEILQKKRSMPFFLWKMNFIDVFQRDNPGFDVVIANPPYVGEKGHKEIFREIKISEFGRRFYKRKMDLFYFFFHKSIDLSRKNATVSFITTNYFITADGAVYLRTDFKNRISVYKMINFNELRIFETAKGQHNLITILRNQISPESIVKTSVTHRVGNATSELLNNILNWNDRETDYFSLLQEELYDGEKNYIRLNASSAGNSSPIQRILSKVKKDSTILGKIKNVNQGLLTGADKVTDGQIEKLNLTGLEKGEGIYVLSNDEIKRLNLNSTEEKIIKPFYKNSDINKYFTSSIAGKKNLIYLTRDLKIDDFPHIKNHVFKYQKIIKNRSQERGEMQAALKLGKWWVIFASRNNVNFEGKKIVCPQRSLSNTFGYNEEPWYSSADVYYITDKEEGKKCSLKYILSLLNSKLYYVWLYNRGKRKGELLELLYQPLSEIPIKEISPEQQKPFIQLVDQILSITKDNDYLDNPDKKTKVKKLEKEINQLVYKLYELTPEEIKIVDKFNGGK